MLFPAFSIEAILNSSIDSGFTWTKTWTMTMGNILISNIHQRQLQNSKKGVTQVPAFAGINSSGGPVVLEKSLDSRFRGNDILGVSQLAHLSLKSSIRGI
jgi:hypothetical protein